MLDVKKTLKAAEDRMNSAAKYLNDELARIRAGRANVAILDGVRVMSYGSMVPLNQVANITVPDQGHRKRNHGQRRGHHAGEQR